MSQREFTWLRGLAGHCSAAARLLWSALPSRFGRGARILRCITMPGNQRYLKRTAPRRTGGWLSTPQRHQQHVQQQRTEHKPDHSATLAASDFSAGIRHSTGRAHVLQTQLGTGEQAAIRRLKSIGGFVVLVGEVFDTP